MIRPAEPRLGPFRAALLYGLAWGLGEATLGHVLHLARVPVLPGLVMASFAAAIMGRVASASRRGPAAAAVLLAGAVAASCKLLDLAVPGTDPLAVINPIQAILLESLAGGIWVKATTGLLPSARVRSLPSDGRP